MKIIEGRLDADAELVAARRWYGEGREIAARALGTEVARVIRQMEAAPDRWKRYGRDTLRFFLPNFPFSLIYRERQDAVEIVAFAYHRRRPRYWRGR